MKDVFIADSFVSVSPLLHHHPRLRPFGSYFASNSSSYEQVPLLPYPLPCFPHVLSPSLSLWHSPSLSPLPCACLSFATARVGCFPLLLQLLRHPHLRD